MEIKILCTCGTKFKFDVEPVRGRMPAPANCPSCGADATDQANAIIKSTLAAETPTPQPTAPPAGPAASPQPGGLRISRSPSPAAEPSATPESPPPPPRVAPVRAIQAATPAKSSNNLVKGISALLIFLVAGFGAWKVGKKWFKRLNLVADVASAAGSASVDKGESEGAKNLWYEDCAMLFIRHTNHLEIGHACQEFWKTKLHKNLAMLDSNKDYQEPGEYELIPAHNGYVRIITVHDWPVDQQESLAKDLSQKFGTLAFEWRTEHFADTYHFGVYDQGARKFHAQMDIKINGDNADEIVTTEGNEFAIANGYKPGENGFKEFNELDADRITRKLGMKLWDEKDGTVLKGVLLKEGAPGKN